MTDSETFIEAVREDNQTELSRLGSSKSLYADTGGDIDTEPVLRATADAEHAAWQTFEAWADSEEDEAARDVFDTTAAEERAHYETVIDYLDVEDYEPGEIPDLHEYLRGLESTVERAGALIGRILASKRSEEQVVGYFVGDADPQTAGVFREFGAELDDQLERAGELLEDVCDSADDDERAQRAATGAIEAAYDEYVANLEAMGANPKPVC